MSKGRGPSLSRALSRAQFGRPGFDICPSPSRKKPSLSRGIQAEPSRNITKEDSKWTINVENDSSGVDEIEPVPEGMDVDQKQIWKHVIE